MATHDENPVPKGRWQRWRESEPVETVVGWWTDQPAFVKDAEIFASIGLVLVGLGWGAWQWARDPYQAWQKEKFLKQARAQGELGDHRGALLTLRRAVELAPTDVATWNEIATYLAKVGSSEVVNARQQLVRLAPEDYALRLALVKEALGQGNTLLAQEQLDTWGESARTDASFHRMAAALAMMQGRSEALATHLQALLQVEPNDQGARFQLAALQVWGANASAAREGRATLNALLADAEWRVRAALELIKIAALEENRAWMDLTVSQLLSALDPQGPPPTPPTNWADEPLGWTHLSNVLGKLASRRPNDAALYASWWGTLEGEAVRAETWLGTLPAPLVEDPGVRSVRARLLLSVGDLDRLDGALAAGAWGPVKRDVLSLAISARVQAKIGANGRALETWADAVRAAKGDLNNLRVLTRLADGWQQSKWSVEALWPLVIRYPGERWAPDALRVLLAANREAEPLWRLYALWAARASDDAAVQATWMMLGSLLQRSTPEVAMAAERLRGRTHGNLRLSLAVVAADWRGGRLAEARAMLAQLPPESLAVPEVQLWGGVIAAADKRWDEAERLLSTLTPPNWLDETGQLWAATLANVKREQSAAIARREVEEMAAARSARLSAGNSTATPGQSADSQSAEESMRLRMSDLIPRPETTK